MAINLRMPPGTAELLRVRAHSSGLSQNAIILEALESYLGIEASRPDSVERLLARGILKPPRIPYREATVMLKLPDGVTSLELLDREDRF